MVWFFIGLLGLTLFSFGLSLESGRYKKAGGKPKNFLKLPKSERQPYQDGVSKAFKVVGLVILGAMASAWLADMLYESDTEKAESQAQEEKKQERLEQRAAQKRQEEAEKAERASRAPSKVLERYAAGEVALVFANDGATPNDDCRHAIVNSAALVTFQLIEDRNKRVFSFWGEKTPSEIRENGPLYVDAKRGRFYDAVPVFLSHKGDELREVGAKGSTWIFKLIDRNRGLIEQRDPDGPAGDPLSKLMGCRTDTLKQFIATLPPPEPSENITDALTYIQGERWSNGGGLCRNYSIAFTRDKGLVEYFRHLGAGKPPAKFRYETKASQEFIYEDLLIGMGGTQRYRRYNVRLVSADLIEFTAVKGGDSTVSFGERCSSRDNDG